MNSIRWKRLVFCCSLGLGLGFGQVACQKEKNAQADSPKEVLPSPEKPRVEVAKRPSDDEVGGYEEVIPPSQEAPSRQDKEFQLGMVGDTQFLRVFADGFPNLKVRERLLSYHLARAALAGRDITFDQISTHGLDVRHMVECILMEKAAKASALEDALQNYLAQLSIHQGFYDALSGKKIEPIVSFEQLSKAAHAAFAAGGAMGLNRGESLEEKLERLRPVLLDPAVKARRCPPADARPGVDLSECSLNLYRNVAMRELRDFEEKYPFNSRLVRLGGRFVEEVYRSGDKRTQVPPGRYAAELKRVIGRLQDAMTTASRSERIIMSELVEFFSSGDPFAFDNAMRAWVGIKPRVEFHLGFSDRSVDPRGVKALYRGVVGILDGAASLRLESLVRQIPFFEERMPWSREYRRRWGDLPSVRAVQAITTTGSAGPLCQVAFSLTPDRTSGELSPGKILIFTNIIESLLRGAVAPAMQEFIPETRRERDQDHLRDVFGMRTVIREVLGRYLGQTGPQFIKRLRGAGLILQELKAELTGLWLLDDPKLVELGLVADKVAFEVGVDQFVVEALVAEALGRHDSQWPEDKARRILMRYLVEQAKVVEFEDIGGKIYPKLTDPAAVKDALRKLLLRCERILVEGDRVSALRLLDGYGARPKWPELEQLRQRAQAAGLGRLQVCVMPKLQPLPGANGRYQDASVNHKESLHRQVIRYSRY